MLAASPPTLVIQVAELLNLVGISGESAFGRVGGFPLAVTPIGENAQHGLLLQIRFPCNQVQDLTSEDMQWETIPLEFLEDGETQADVEQADGIAWLTVRSLADIELLPQLVQYFMNRLSDLGIDPYDGICHFCVTNPSNDLVFVEDRVTQMCQQCLDERQGLRHKEQEASIAGVAGALVIGSVASLIGAVLWVGTWLLWFFCISLLAQDDDVIILPSVVSIVQVVVIGGACGWVVGFAVSLIPKRGDKAAGVIAVICALGAVMMGEIVLVMSIAPETEQAPFVPTILDLWWAEGASGIWRGLTALVVLVVAHQVARPRLTPLLS